MKLKKGITIRLTKGLVFLPAFLFMVTFAYCQDVHYNYDRGTNFATYKTYQWVDIPGGVVTDQLIDRDIKRAVDGQLAEKGLTRVEKNADLYVGYQAVITEEKGVNLTGMGGGPGWGGWGPWGDGPVRCRARHRPFPSARWRCSSMIRQESN